MAWAQEMKTLAADIKTSHRDRTRYVNDVKKDTHELIAQFQNELKEMAADLKDFLAKSEETRKKDEETRKKDFNAMMGTIRARIKEIEDNVKDFLAKSEGKRMADFKAMMKDITSQVEGITKMVREMLGDYRRERKEAAGYWASLTKKGAASPVEKKVEAAPRAAKEGEKE